MEDDFSKFGLFYSPLKSSKIDLYYDSGYIYGWLLIRGKIKMITGILSDSTFNSSMEPHLHRTLGEISNDSSLVGNMKNYRRIQPQAPSINDLDNFLDHDAHKFYSQEQIDFFRKSVFYDLVNTAVKELGVRCCDKAVRLDSSKLSPHDLVDLYLNPPAIQANSFAPFLKVKFTNYVCEQHKTTSVHDLSYTMPRYRGMVELKDNLTFADLFCLFESNISYEHMLGIPLIDIINAYGVDVTSYFRTGRSTIERNKFNTSFYPGDKDFMGIYREYAEGAAYGEGLMWLMIAGWRSGSKRVLRSRIAVTRKIRETVTPQEVMEYLNAGVSNIRLIPKFIKASLSPSMVSAAYANGLTDPKTMKKISDEGVDISLMEDLLSSAFSEISF